MFRVEYGQTQVGLSNIEYSYSYVHINIHIDIISISIVNL